MKVLMLNPAFSGGLYTHHLCQALGEAGCEVVLFTGPEFLRTIGEEAPLKYTARIAFYRRTQFPSYEPGPLRPLWRVARFVGHVLGLWRVSVALRRYDILHIQFVPLPGLDSRWLRWAARRIRVVYTVHNLYPHDARQTSALRRTFRRLYDASTALITHTRSTAEGLQRDFAVPAAKVDVIPHGAIAPTRRMSEGNAPTGSDGVSGAPTILLFGAVRHNKGPDVLLRAAAELRDAGLQFRIVMAGRCDIDESPYRTLAQDLGIQDLVSFRLEHVPEWEVEALFRTATVVALPYRSIDQSGVAVMAITLGRPVVATRVGGIAELVEAADCGLVVPVDDPASLAGALRRMLEDDVFRERCERNAHVFAASALAWPPIAKDTLAVYQRASESPRAMA